MNHDHKHSAFHARPPRRFRLCAAQGLREPRGVPGAVARPGKARGYDTLISLSVSYRLAGSRARASRPSRVSACTIAVLIWLSRCRVVARGCFVGRRATSRASPCALHTGRTWERCTARARERTGGARDKGAQGTRIARARRSRPEPGTFVPPARRDARNQPAIVLLVPPRAGTWPGPRS